MVKMMVMEIPRMSDVVVVRLDVVESDELMAYS